MSRLETNGTLLVVISIAFVIMDEVGLKKRGSGTKALMEGVGKKNKQETTTSRRHTMRNENVMTGTASPKHLRAKTNSS